MNVLTPSDLAFRTRFEDCTLSEAEWTHLAHIRVAWICLTEGAGESALQRIRDGILRFNTNVLGRRHKYHETVTVAFAHIVSARMKEGESWSEFAMRIDDLLSTEKPVLLGYYSGARLFSDNARSEFLEPDLKPIPPLHRL